MTYASHSHRFLTRGIPAGCSMVVALLLGGFVLMRHAVRIPEGEAEYVALGSSFAAGPGVGNRLAGSYFPCLRSDANYAHILAKVTGLKLKDVSCSGATTSDVLHGGQFFQPAQLNAVTSQTKLVTVTVGGNDVFYLGNLGAWACANAPADVPRVARWIGLCRTHSNARVEEAFAVLPKSMIAIVEEVHRRAPTARVIFVDYTNVLPAEGTCSRLHLTMEEADAGRKIAARLAALTAEVAWKTHSGLIQASQIAQGHDVCSAQPWVYGFQFPTTALTFGPAPFHPKVEAMQAIAKALANDSRT